MLIQPSVASPLQLPRFPVAGRAQPPFEAGCDDLPGQTLTATYIPPNDVLSHLDATRDSWWRLVERALEPNVFYEPPLLQSALKAWGTSQHVGIVAVDAPRRKWPDGPRVLCGLFPIVHTRHAGQRCVALWRHHQCYLSTPLIRTDVAQETLNTFLDFLASPAMRVPLMRMEMSPGEGPFHKLLVETLHHRQQGYLTLDRYTRAFFLREFSADDFLQNNLSRKRRHELKRQLRRLEEQHRVSFRSLNDAGDVDAWVDQFLRLESSGWKQRSATALACEATDATFFRDALRTAHERGSLMMMSLDVNDVPVAMKCNLLSGQGGFAFKIAYDERFAEYSPGALLELENIRQLHSLPTTLWMDSCAMPSHSLINPLWPDRRIVQTILFSTGCAPGDLTIATTPLLKWIRDTVCNRPE